MIDGTAWVAPLRWMTELAPAAVGGLVAAVWQGALLSLLVALGFWRLPKTPAAVRFAIWFGVFMVVAVLPSAGLLRDGATAHSRTPWVTLDERWCLIAWALWGVASLVRAITLVLAVFRVRALWKRATPLRFEHCNAVSGHRSSKLRALTERGAELCVSGEVDRPTVIGFFSPKMVIPAWLVEKLTAAELEQIVLHESAHLSRADDWINLVQKIVLVVFPLNPALAWVERRLCFERELACDERVLETTRAPKAYAECLASLAEHRLGRRRLVLALGAVGRGSELAERVHRILRRGERMRPAQARFMLGGAVLSLLAMAAGLARCPELVGFSSPVEAVVAMNHIASGSQPRLGYGYQPVVFHPGAESTMQLPVKANKIRPTAVIPQSGRVKLTAAQSMAHVLRADAVQATGLDPDGKVVERPAVGAVSESDVAFDESARQAAKRSAGQWVVVSAWRGDDGSRLVLTTFQSTSHVEDREDRRAAVRSYAIRDQVQRYAAVPVTGGWIVIQL